MSDRVETPRQLAERLVNVSERKIRNLIKSGELDVVQIGSRLCIPIDAWAEMIKRKRRRWQDATKAPDSNGTAAGAGTTSAGMKVDATSSALLAQRTAKKLKLSSR